MTRQTLASLRRAIKRRFTSHLSDLGLIANRDGHLRPSGRSKRSVRRIHRSQRAAILAKRTGFVEEYWPKLREFFADGEDVDPIKIRPRLEMVASNTWQSNLFRLATLTWSVPVSPGYGRRLRFLVWDESNEKLIGLMGLGDPVFNLRVRDEWISWGVEERARRLVNVMDAYVLGALPPYNSLLGGKLVACLVRTREVRDAFAAKYGRRKGIISQKRKHPALALVTTTSALGRSSVYNRLTLGGRRYFEHLGFTTGWGHFHVPDSLFTLVREYLAKQRDEYYDNHEFGDGPNWRLRAVRKVLSSVGLSPRLMHHGIEREVFACEIADNAKSLLRGDVSVPDYGGLLSVAEVGDLARTRWLEPRATRLPDFQRWKRASLTRSFKARSNGR